MIPHGHRSLGSRAAAFVAAAVVSVALTSRGAAAATTATTARPSHSRRNADERALTFEARVDAQRAIEEVYWSHRIWPEQNRQPKPPLAAVMTEGALRAKVEDYLKKSNALETVWNRPISAAELQAEMNRMAANTRDAQLLTELFAALGNDPSLIAETLARQTLADRTLREAYAAGSKAQSFDGWWSGHSATMSTRITTEPATFAPAAIDTTGCVANTWTPLSTAHADPTPRHYHAAVWTGAEMIVWGGRDGSTYFNTGGRYDPATDTWFATSTGPNDPEPRQRATGVWTGTEMIVWGGFSNDNGFLHSGGRYNPITDTWTPTSTGANVPHGRSRHTAVWTGSEMIVWGGFYQAGDYFYTTDGGRYDPVTDTWTATSMGANLPAGRSAPSSVWTGTEMIVWGGDLEGPPELNTGGRYNPATDSWAPTSIGANVPDPRSGHTVVWTGSEMIVWGGAGGAAGDVYLQSGGRYNPATDSWQPTSTGANVPSPRFFTASVWSGSEMVIWGGYGATYFDTGGRYNPLTDAWTPTSTGPNNPQARYYHSGVWTGNEMIVWSGLSGDGYVNTGARYCACAAPVTVYRDADGDGYGNPAQSIAVCAGTTPAGYVADATDCDDGNAAVHPGASESCNGLDDNCDGIVDNGGALLCNDGNPCTNDACNGLAGCAYANNSNPCDDGNACTTGDTCGGGTCNGGPALNCGDSNPCTDDSCSPAAGCVHTNNSNPCDDGNACTTGDTCGGGTCNGGPALDCGDSNPCTDDSCSPAAGCVHTNNSDPCDDGNACTTGDTCGGGTCNGGPALNCGDSNPCTDDSCSPAAGCVHTNNSDPCDDGNACTTGDTCGGGTCNGGPAPNCSDNNPCTDDSCNPAAGCVHTNNTNPCDDGNACTTGDTCGGGTCNGGPAPNCSDNNPCTDDSCNPAAGCVHTNNTNPCDDGNACTIGDTCGGGSCLAGAPAPPPPNVDGLTLDGEIDTTLSWTGLDATDLYDIEGSTLSELSVNGTSTAACIADNVAGTSYLSSQAEPEPGDGYYYLVRADNACGQGSYGTDSAGAERARAPLCP